MLGKKLIPMIEIANDLANLTYLFDQVLQYMPYSNVLVYAFPWVKDLIRDIRHEDNELLIRWMTRNNVRVTDNARKTMISQFDALLNGRGTNWMPTLTDEINRVVKYGALAFTQYRIMKDADHDVKVPPGYATIAPTHAANAASDKVQSDFALVRDYYRGYKQV